MPSAAEVRAGVELPGDPLSESPVYLTTVRGSAMELLPFDRAEALLEQVSASPALDVTGDMANGFAWSSPGAVPRHSTTVVPLPTPIWPHSPYATPVVIELWFPADRTGWRSVRSFLGWFAKPYDAYLTACCLWSTRSTGADAEAAFLYGPDRTTAYRINAFAKTCSQLPAKFVAGIAATMTARDTTDPLPDSMLPGLSEATKERAT